MKALLYIFWLLLGSFLYSQNDSVPPPKKSAPQTLQLQPVKYNPLSPSKAAFYSAILPGAGQIYNNRYWWQLPLIYGGLGTSVYYYTHNNREYKRFRTAFKRRKAGLPDDFDGQGDNPLISDAGLQNAQKQLIKNRDLSLLMVILTYVLQIVEASVTAHLLQFDDSNRLSVQPATLPQYSLEDPPKVGLALKYSF